MVNYIKTTKNRDKCRMLLRSDPSAARDILPKEGDLGPNFYNVVTWHHAAGSFETLRGPGQEGGPVVVNCIKTTKHRDKFRSLLRPDPSAARDIFPSGNDLSLSE